MQCPYRAAGIANGLLHEVHALRQSTPLVLQPGILCNVATQVQELAQRTDGFKHRFLVVNVSKDHVRWVSWCFFAYIVAWTHLLL